MKWIWAKVLETRAPTSKHGRTMNLLRMKGLSCSGHSGDRYEAPPGNVVLRDV